MENQSWNNWKYHKHWKQLELINSKNHIEGNNYFYISYNKLCLKNNNKTTQ